MNEIEKVFSDEHVTKRRGYFIIVNNDKVVRSYIPNFREAVSDAQIFSFLPGDVLVAKVVLNVKEI